MSEELDATAALAYDAYRTSHAGTVAGGLPMPMWEHLSVPERDAWLAVAGAVVPPDPPELMRRQEDAPHAPAPPARWTQADLEQLTVSALRELAQHADVHLGSSVSKQDIIDALLAHQAGQTMEG